MFIEIGQRIRQLRKEVAKVSQFEFSERLGITQANLSMLENGKINPSCFLLLKLSIIYKINLNWLFTGQGEIIMPLLLECAKENIKATDKDVII